MLVILLIYSIVSESIISNWNYRGITICVTSIEYNDEHSEKAWYSIEVTEQRIVIVDI